MHLVGALILVTLRHRLGTHIQHSKYPQTSHAITPESLTNTPVLPPITNIVNEHASRRKQ
jgi:hypothetical protein